MTHRKQLRIVLSAFFPDQLRNKILLAKNFVHQQPQVVIFKIIDADADYALLIQ